MLVLSRKKEEVIVIDNKIRIKIIDIGSDMVKLGIDAPNHVKIYREEIWKSIQEENISAVSKNAVVTENITLLNKQLAKHISKGQQSSHPQKQTKDTTKN